MQRLRAFRQGDATYFLGFITPLDQLTGPAAFPTGSGGGTIVPEPSGPTPTPQTPVDTSALPPLTPAIPQVPSVTPTAPLPALNPIAGINYDLFPCSVLVGMIRLASDPVKKAAMQASYSSRCGGGPVLGEGQHIPTLTMPLGTAIPVVNVGPNSAFNPTGGGGGGSEAGSKAPAKPEYWKWALVAGGLGLCFYMTR